jgi:DNA-binding NarL/FixJ family response regulator
MEKRQPPMPGPGKVRVLLVDDHPIVRQGLSQLVGQEPDMEVCGEAESASAALKAIAALKPTVAVVDLSLKQSSGLELIKDIKVRHPDLPVLVLSMHDESFYAERALRAGARGYMMKEEAAEKIRDGIRRVAGGEVYVSDAMASRLLSTLVSGPRPLGGSGADLLSDRELEVFELIGRGVATRTIAAQLHLSIKTIESHRANIKRKLNLQSATELMQRAMQWVESEKKDRKPPPD